MPTVTARILYPHGEPRIPVTGEAHWVRRGETISGGVIYAHDAFVVPISEGVMCPVEVEPGEWRVTIRPRDGLAFTMYRTVGDSDMDLAETPPVDVPAGGFTYEALLGMTYDQLGG